MEIESVDTYYYFGVIANYKVKNTSDSFSNSLWRFICFKCYLRTVVSFSYRYKVQMCFNEIHICVCV
jgi:hypothetical protein